MSVVEIEREAPVWDPTAAYRAHVVEQKEREKSAEIQQSLARMASTGMVNMSVTIPNASGEKQRVGMPEYVVWLEAQADAAREEVERFGGQAAVDAVYARIRSGISYAGEVAPSPQPNPMSVYPNFPA